MTTKGTEHDRSRLQTRRTHWDIYYFHRGCNSKSYPASVGFLGIGNKMFAVPFAAFKVKPSPSDRSDMVLVLDVTQKQMEGAVGFDEDHWPDFADKKFQMELNKRYSVKRDPGVNVEVGRDGVKVDVNRDKN